MDSILFVQRSVDSLEIVTLTNYLLLLQSVDLEESWFSFLDANYCGQALACVFLCFLSSNIPALYFLL